MATTAELKATWDEAAQIFQNFQNLIRVCKKRRAYKRHEADVLQEVKDLCAQVGPARREANECRRVWETSVAAAAARLFATTTTHNIPHRR